jgi:uncharacterized membrane protein SirB2
MDDFYAEIRMIHAAAAACSGLLFILRATGRNMFSASWPMAPTVRLLALAVNSVLLIAAAALTTIVRQFPLVDGWLTVKLVLLIAYLSLGHLALRNSSSITRLAATAGAILAFSFIGSVADARHPLGAFR